MVTRRAQHSVEAALARLQRSDLTRAEAAAIIRRAQEALRLAVKAEEAELLEFLRRRLDRAKHLRELTEQLCAGSRATLETLTHQTP